MKILVEFTRRHPRRTAISVVWLLVAGLAETLGLSAIVPLAGLIIRNDAAGDAAREPSSIERAFDDALERLSLDSTLQVLLVLTVGAFVLKGLVVLLARRQVGYTVTDAITELRLRLVHAVLGTEWSYFVRQRIGRIANSFGLEAQQASKAYRNAMYLVMLSIQFVAAIGVALVVSWRVTLSLLGIGAVVLFVLRPLIRMGRKAGVRRTRLSRIILGRLVDVLQGVKPVKAMAREPLVAPLLEGDTHRLGRAMRKEVLAEDALTSLQEPLVVVLLLGGLYAVRGAFEVTDSMLAVVSLFVLRGFQVANRAQSRYQKTAVREAAYFSLIREVENAERMREELHGGAPPSLRRGIEFQGVSFTYGDETILGDLDLEVPAGEITAITGPSGAGKTTIGDLVAGLVQPAAGVVRVDGTPLDELDLGAWRHRLGYVPQEMFLLHDTVAMNVTLGDPEVTPEDLARALREAHAWDFVCALPEGVETVVGERGSRLSGGQRQRIAIARALVHRPWLLILDEATAALDPASEAEVWQVMKELRGHTTILAISHQQALREVADRVYRVEGGRAELLPTGTAAAS